MPVGGLWLSAVLTYDIFVLGVTAGGHLPVALESSWTLRNGFLFFFNMG